ncbi:LLM class flavin-dependent oxidoreductase [Kineococcus sp. SYSU DK004]|uniref:LLM class flavin-dependent oxidoreductase n=1 Tax=Kineococcus sp. SYSU DK004 TaxID=3383125 RepID=UPI003D7D735E
MLHLAIELDGAGRHPAAWRLPGADPGGLFGAAHHVRLAQLADAADADLVVHPDAFADRSARDGEQRGRLDAVALASRVAPLTTRAGLVPVVTTTWTEPFHTAKAVATLDIVSAGRAGVQLDVSRTAQEARAFVRSGTGEPGRGADDALDPADLWEEAAETVEALRLLWDSWEDDAVVRDVATGRYVDRDKLHHVDVVGRRFSVRGPSITPRPPQGQPLVLVAADDGPSLRVAARHADVVRVAAPDLPAAAERARAVRREAAGRRPAVLLDVEVLLRPETTGEGAGEGAGRVLDRLEGWAPGHPARSLRLAGTPADLVALLADVAAEADLDGAALVPLDLPASLELVAAEVVPALRERGLRPAADGPAPALRERFGLPRPANRFATPTTSSTTAAPSTSGAPA